MRSIIALLVTLSCASVIAASEFTHHSSSDNSTRLTLAHAIERAQAASPVLSSARSELHAAEGALDQAGYWPNPELGLEAENFAGTGTYRTVDRAVYTLSLTQKVELGGKREYRLMAASQALERQRQRLLAERLGLIKRVTIAYMKVIAAQEQLKLSTERTDLAQTLFNEIQQRVAAARAPQMQLNQAEIALTTARLRQETHGRELQHSQHVLASFWLMRHEDYRYDATPFFQLIEPIDEQEMEARLREHPVLQSWRMEQKRQQALLALENAEATPDLSVQLGVREFRETGDQGLVIGFSIPLPIFNRNQGNIERASALLGKSASDEQNAWLNLTGDGLQALEDTINAYRQAVTLSQSVIPAAEQGFTLAHEGYIAGRFPYLEVLSAQRTLFDSKESYLAALAHYQVAKARVDYVMATYLGVRQ